MIETRTDRDPQGTGILAWRTAAPRRVPTARTSEPTTEFPDGVSEARAVRSRGALDGHNVLKFPDPPIFLPVETCMAQTDHSHSDAAEAELRAGLAAEALKARTGAARRIRLVTNMTAAADEMLRTEIEALREAGHTIDVRVAWDGGDAVTFAEEAAAAGYDVVAAAGGDGTVNAVVQGLLRGEEREGFTGPLPALGLVPFGTANDLATTCGFSSDQPHEMVRMLGTATPAPVDVGFMNGRPFLNVASGGYAAEVTTETEPGMKKFLGGLAYWLTGLTSLSRIEPRPIRLTAGDLRWEGRVFAVAVCNGRQAGGGLLLAPHALLDDGAFDVAIIPEVPWTEFVELYADLRRMEAAVRSEHIVHGRAERVLIEAPEGLQVNLDGEPVNGERFEFVIKPRHLPCLLSERCAPLTGRPDCALVPPEERRG